jgi:competence protein ComFC
MASLGSWLLDLFYPPRCMICHRLLRSGEREICPGCLQSLPDYDGPEPQVRFAEHCAVTFYYEGRLRESFLRYKFSGLRQYAERYGSWMAGTIRDKLAGSYELLTWVPVSAPRKRRRGYDQAELLARAVGRELGLEPVRTLRKTVDNREQSGLGGAPERAANAAGVYVPAEPQNYAGKRILLIDDIVTTGATLSECSRVLRTAGAAEVVCAALAAPREHRER